MRSEKIEANTEAQRKRHMRVFLTGGVRTWIIRFLPTFRRFFRDVHATFFSKRKRKVLANEILYIRDPFSKFLKQTFVIGGALLILTSFAPSQLLETGFTADYFDSDTDFVDTNDELTEQVFIMNDEGFVLKPSPVSEETNRIGLTDSVQHTVVSGDTLSGIAALYGVSVRTLLWENNISETASLRVGQVLTVPAVDGISHTVAAKDTLASIAESYKVDVQLIKDHNNLADDSIQQGQKIFIPGGKKKEPPPPPRVIGSTRGGRVSYNTYDSKVVMGSDDAPNQGKQLIYPTNGNLTQGFRAGHLALDIANSSKPDVWAGAEGSVIKAQGGCAPREVKVEKSCGGGYGNYVVIDHGNGLQTLYAHLETIYVSEGQGVSRGQAIGKMGSSGRTYGKTGIHLHFEVFDNGVKRNPNKYF